MRRVGDVVLLDHPADITGPRSINAYVLSKRYLFIKYRQQTNKSSQKRRRLMLRPSMSIDDLDCDALFSRLAGRQTASLSAKPPRRPAPGHRAG
jgi:hypothetical protein